MEIMGYAKIINIGSKLIIKEKEEKKI